MTDELTNKTLRDAVTPKIDENDPAHKWGEAEYASRGRVYGGIAAGNGQLGASMTRQQCLQLIADFEKAGVSKASVLEAMRGSGIDTTGL